MEAIFNESQRQLVESRPVFGLTGGMGSGKSTVSEALSERGVAIIDADLVVRELQQPGELALDEMVRILGDEIVNDDATLNREIAGKLMFSNPDRRRMVEGVLKPHIQSRMFGKLAQINPTQITALDVPLLLEAGWNKLPLKGVVVVDTSTENAVQRLTAYRGFSEDEARRRIEIQMPREQKLKHADFVITNNGSRDDLESEVDSAWRWMRTIAGLGGIATRSITKEED